MDDSKIPWDWVILGALRTGFEADLSEIYDTIDRVKKAGSSIISVQLFDIEPRWGERPKYYHSVRAAVHKLRKLGMIERIARGRYQITDAGRDRLEELES